MGKRKPHHPPIPGTIAEPISEAIGYIYGSQAVAGFGCRAFYVAAIPSRLARQVIIERHYSGRIVNNSYVHLGVFIGGEMLGVLQFGYMLTPRAMEKIVAGTAVEEYLELNRMWLDDRAARNSESRALSYAFSYIRRACPRVKWVQSFADERCGVGVVYQAAGFDYIGHHWTCFYELDGETYHEMLLTAHQKGGGRGVYLRENLHRATRRKLRQFRYIRFLKPRARKYLKMPIQPFPKPGAASRRDAPPARRREPGSTPGGRSTAHKRP